MGRSAKSEPVGPIRVALVCPRALPRAGLCRLLDAGAFPVVWQRADGVGLVDGLRGCLPDLIMLAWEADGVGVPLVEELIAAGTEAPIVVIGPANPHQDLYHALEAGAVGCLSCDLDAPDFLAALKMVADGDIVVSHDMVPATTGADGPRRPENRLTPRELEVLRALGRGASNREIAEQLYLSPHTVKIHVHKVLLKMGFRNRQQAAVYAAGEGLL